MRLGGRILKPASLDLDHCFPWAAWPCDHPWNLMPCLPAVNNRKRDRLPGDATLRSARDRILEWWDRGYRSGSDALAGRFMNEARAGLPAMPDEGDRLEDVFAGLALQRLRLSHDQQVPEWNAAGLQRHDASLYVEVGESATFQRKRPASASRNAATRCWDSY